jgi:hypothetical protein
MKIIITEEQYNELNKADDVYNNLTPYFRRRVNLIDIPKTIEDKISFLYQDWYKQMSMNYLVRLVVNHIVWETIPSEWGGSDDTRNLGDFKGYNSNLTELPELEYVGDRLSLRRIILKIYPN